MDIYENLLLIRRRNWSEDNHNEHKRNTSYDKAVIRSNINDNELNKMLNLCRTNKKYIIKSSLIRSESEYNQDIKNKLSKMGKILSKIPHPKKSSYVNYSILPQSDIKQSFHKRNNSAKVTRKALSSDNYLVQFQEELRNILASNHHFVLDNTQNISAFNRKSKFKKLQTIYKYISDPDMKFHYFKDDFNNQSRELKYKGKTPTRVYNPEYKFIKMKDDSFYVLNTLQKAINCIINHFFMAYNNEQLYKKEQAMNLMEYSAYLKDVYDFYKREINEIANNYAVLTKGLVYSTIVYSNYVLQLSKYTEEQTKEETLFKKTYRQMILNESTVPKTFEFSS